jgi:hypothetical protein
MTKSFKNNFSLAIFQFIYPLLEVVDDFLIEFNDTFGKADRV